MQKKRERTKEMKRKKKNRKRIGVRFAHNATQSLFSDIKIETHLTVDKSEFVHQYHRPALIIIIIIVNNNGIKIHLAIAYRDG